MPLGGVGLAGVGTAAAARTRARGAGAPAGGRTAAAARGAGRHGGGAGRRRRRAERARRRGDEAGARPGGRRRGRRRRHGGGSALAGGREMFQRHGAARLAHAAGLHGHRQRGGEAARARSSRSSCPRCRRRTGPTLPWGSVRLRLVRRRSVDLRVRRAASCADRARRGLRLTKPPISGFEEVNVYSGRTPVAHSRPTQTEGIGM